MGYRYTRLYNEYNSADELDSTDRRTSFILWKRLQLCNAKLSNVSEFTSLMSFFAVVSK